MYLFVFLEEAFVVPASSGCSEEWKLKLRRGRRGKKTLTRIPDHATALKDNGNSSYFVRYKKIIFSCEIANVM